jgi:hypothetical protein
MLKATLIRHDAYYLDDYPSIDSYLEIIGIRTCEKFLHKSAKDVFIGGN